MYVDEKGVLHAEEDDQCYTCRYSEGKKPCPLVEALAYGLVSIATESEDLTVSDCTFYKEKNKHLRIVK